MFPIQQAAYYVISAVAFIGNTLVILVFVLDKKLLKKSYKNLILSLAIADVLTAISLITNVAFVLDNAIHPILGELFCRLIWNRFLPYQLVIFSLYICLVLSVERWFAVVKPQKYSDIFSMRRVIGYIFASWAWSLLISSTALFGTTYSPSRQMCEFQILLKGSVARVLLGIFQVTMMMFFPCLVMIGLYIHMFLTVRGSAVASAASKAKLRGTITRMVAVIYIMLIIFFAPFQIFLVLSFAGKTKLCSKAHHAVSTLTYVSICVNPVIYGLSNKNYRQGYKKILFAVCPRVFGGSGNGIRFVNRRQPRVEPGPQAGADNL